MKPHTKCLTCLFLIAVAAVPASADMVPDFKLVQPDLTGSPGDTLTWTYDVTNNSTTEFIYGLYVNAGIFTGGIPDATVFDYFGAGIAPGASLTGPLYSFISDPSVLNSFNSGTFDLGILFDDGSTTDVYANYSATISPGVSAVPEPASWTLIGIQLAVFSILALRHRRHRKT